MTYLHNETKEFMDMAKEHISELFYMLSDIRDKEKDFKIGNAFLCLQQLEDNLQDIETILEGHECEEWLLD